MVDGVVGVWGAGGAIFVGVKFIFTHARRNRYSNVGCVCIVRRDRDLLRSTHQKERGYSKS